MTSHPNPSGFAPNACPVCGQPNACAMESKSEAPCWCTQLVFTREVLQRIPEAARGWACLCSVCAQAAADKPQ